MHRPGRRRVPMPNMNYSRYSHDELKAMTDAANVGGSAEIAATWGHIAERLRQAGAALATAARGSTARWQGEAANAMRNRLHGVAAWSTTIGNGFAEVCAAITRQADAADHAKTAMPQKVAYEPEKMIAEAAGDPALMATLPNRMHLRRQQSQAALEQARRVVRARDVALAEAAGTVAVLVPPPGRVADGGDGDGRRPPRPPDGDGGSGGGGAAPTGPGAVDPV